MVVDLYIQYSTIGDHQKLSQATTLHCFTTWFFYESPFSLDYEQSLFLLRVVERNKRARVGENSLLHCYVTSRV